MPFINVKTNVKISSEKEKALKYKLGEAITVVPGKSESRLMLNFEDECRMYFRGDGDIKIAMVEAGMFGSPAADGLDRFTGCVCDMLKEELDIPPENVYVKYSLTPHWGCNGSNF